VAVAEWNVFDEEDKSPDVYDGALLRVRCHRRRDDNEYATHVVRIFDILAEKKIRGSKCCC
jgi:hypothetical protein